MQIDGCEKNIDSYKIKIDSCAALDVVHKRFEASQATTITKLKNKLQFFKGATLGLAAVVIIRATLTFLKPK